MIVIGVLAAALALATVVTATDSLRRAFPLWRADLAADVRFDWQLLAAIGLTTLALVAWCTTANARSAAISAGAVLATLALPGALPLIWWIPSTVDLLVASALAVVAVLAATGAAARVPAVGAAVLALHAVGASLSRPANTAVVLGGLALLGVVVAGLGRRTEAGQRSPEHRVIGATAGFIALAGLPPAIGCGPGRRTGGSGLGWPA